jgi:hypothetical protein
MHEVFGGLNSGGLSRRRFIAGAGVAAALTGIRPKVQAAEKRAKPPELAWARSAEALQLNFGTRPVARYQVTKPATGGASTESGCYFHPVYSPAGTLVTDIGPEDHRHHRGIFLAWVEVNGAAKGDFWGWGEPAPIAGRRIVNRSLEPTPPIFGSARFRALNEWVADTKVVMKEELRVVAGLNEGATLINLSVQFTAVTPVKLGRWAFGGFAVRTRKDGEVTAVNEAGPVKLAPPRHTEPGSNWPDATWYGLHLKLADGKEATVAVANRPSNPKTSWHVVPSIGLINPCITAPGEVEILPDKPLVLRYRVMVCDGAANLDLLTRLAAAG